VNYITATADALGHPHTFELMTNSAISRENSMNAAEVRELDIHELDAVSGGSIRDAAAIEAYAVARRIDDLLKEEKESAPYVPMKL
jgi:hypothetical protein